MWLCCSHAVDNLLFYLNPFFLTSQRPRLTIYHLCIFHKFFRNSCYLILAYFHTLLYAYSFSIFSSHLMVCIATLYILVFILCLSLIYFVSLYNIVHCHLIYLSLYFFLYFRHCISSFLYISYLCVIQVRIIREREREREKEKKEEKEKRKSQHNTK